MKIPKKLIIGDSSYEVRQCNHIDWNNKSVAGQIDYGKKTIKLLKYKDERAKEDTFFHEVAHGILKELEFNHPKVVHFRVKEEFTQELGLILRKTFKQLVGQ